MVLMTVDIHLLEQDLTHLWPPPHVHLIRTVSIFHGRGRDLMGHVAVSAREHPAEGLRTK